MYRAAMTALLAGSLALLSPALASAQSSPDPEPPDDGGANRTPPAQPRPAPVKPSPASACSTMKNLLSRFAAGKGPAAGTKLAGMSCSSDTSGGKLRVTCRVQARPQKQVVTAFMALIAETDKCLTSGYKPKRKPDLPMPMRVWRSSTAKPKHFVLVASAPHSANSSKFDLAWQINSGWERF